MTVLSLRIKEILKRKGLTMKDLQVKMGMNNLSTLSQSISGNPTLGRIQHIAEALDVPVSELFDNPKSNNFTCPNCGAEIQLEGRLVGDPETVLDSE